MRIEGVEVSFKTRDVNLVTGSELDQLRELVLQEQRDDLVHIVDRIIIFTDYLGRGMRYNVVAKGAVDAIFGRERDA